MGRSKDAFLERTGGFRLGETQSQFQARIREIDELESSLKSGSVKLSNVESIQRRLCDLKGIAFDSNGGTD
ncbi:MAG TPA: hypothetical protein VFO61_05900 [Alphaproteobacteria bacterium]|nr:hypothetical protein [Alphaproteobacteria bacterium]